MTASPPIKTALVTGGADRIGAAIALNLAGAGYNVLIHYRSSAEKAEALVETISTSGGQAATISGDLAKRGERKALIGKAAKVFGPLSVLVNNASLFEPDSIDDIDEALWDAHFAVHAEAPVFLARDFAAQLPDGTKGNIVNIIDERVLHLSPSYLSYTLSKAALWDATRVLAQSLAPDIRVNAIGPGPTLRAAGQSEADFKSSLSSTLLQVGAAPQDIARAILFLLDSPSITGQMLALDGGRHLDFGTRAKTPRRP